MKYDLAVIGAGPAGLMAAISAAELGASVIVYEKNARPALKLLATGGGRCNVTNNVADPKKLAALYEPNDKFLISAFSRFGAPEMMDFLESKGLELKEEERGRVFPVSNKSQDVLSVFLREIRRLRIRLIINSSVSGFEASSAKIKSLLVGENKIEAKNYLISTGGASYPATGSSGDAYKWLKDLGHNIVTPRPALSKIYSLDSRIKLFEGISLSDISLSFVSGGSKPISSRGDAIFTSNGLSGPAAFNLSRFIKPKAKGKIVLDFFPDKDEEELDEELNNIFRLGKKSVKNVLESMLAPKLVLVLLEIISINPEMQANSVTKEKRMALVSTLKSLSFTLSAIGGFLEAMTTAGGLDLKEVDPKTMRSKIYSNLYFAGEILDLSGPSGGYSLQMCWSTGYVAGEAAAESALN